jgi:hypothetical protein
MNSDEEPLQGDSFAPPLPSDFARRVIRQARAQRHRQSRRRLVVLCVICAGVGFGASTLVRARLAKPNAGFASSPSGRSNKSNLKPPVRLADRAEHPALKTPILGRRYDDASAANNGPAARKSSAIGNLAVRESAAAKQSQMLVIESPAHSEEGDLAAPGEAMRPEAPATAPPRPAPELPGASSMGQPSLQPP